MKYVCKYINTCLDAATHKLMQNGDQLIIKMTNLHNITYEDTLVPMKFLGESSIFAFVTDTQLTFVCVPIYRTTRWLSLQNKQPYNTFLQENYPYCILSDFQEMKIQVNSCTHNCPIYNIR